MVGSAQGRYGKVNALAWSSRVEDLRLWDAELGFSSWSWFSCEGGLTAYGYLYLRLPNEMMLELDWCSECMPICEWSIAALPGISKPSPARDHERAIGLRIVAQTYIIYPKELPRRPGTIIAHPDRVGDMDWDIASTPI